MPYYPIEGNFFIPTISLMSLDAGIKDTDIRRRDVIVPDTEGPQQPPLVQGMSSNLASHLSPSLHLVAMSVINPSLTSPDATTVLQKRNSSSSLAKCRPLRQKKASCSEERQVHQGHADR